MLKFLVPAAALALIAAPALAQSQPSSAPPSPNEQVGIHVGDNATNGSAVIVNDRNGVHPEGYTGQPTRNNATSGATHPRRHHRRHPAETPPQG
ncbi:hypothetical protein [Phenylobacterium sp.]|uniref:hypothetical protein n=1 Tax=Phenylobacterium sp. TaxID=1871053 RepID=UPI001213C233|nr:hypothetical protein [Phenylobacterium sp.]THD64105.1 MAG: hypothetical protein E8A49_03680 [Phenylobacterium sp.]